MFKNHRRLTAAVLLSCSCLLAPYYAHAEENNSQYDAEYDKTACESEHGHNYLNITKDGSLIYTLDLYTESTHPGTHWFGDLEEDEFGEKELIESFRDFKQFNGKEETEALNQSLLYIDNMVKRADNAAVPLMALKLFDDKDANASAYSETLIVEGNDGKPIQISDTKLAAVLQGKFAPEPGDIVADITVNLASPNAEWYLDKFPVLPSNGTDSDYYGTITHEMFHALGLGANIYEEEATQGSTELNGDAATIKPLYFGTIAELDEEDEGATSITIFNKYEMGIRDVFGRVVYYSGDESAPVTYDDNPIDPNNQSDWSRIQGELKSRIIVPITLEQYQNFSSDELNPKAFYILQGEDVSNKSGTYFTGKNVNEVLTTNGKLAKIVWPDGSSVEGVYGLPLNGYEGDDANEPELSHIELQNGLMSHQSYRNWCSFMEAELALMQDLGYDIDRSKYFGKSIYNSGTEGNPFIYTNNKAFDSTQMHGIGLHVYGSYVDVTQAADIKADGDYGIGIRVDGVGNKVNIDSNVSANGEGGNGLLVAYGKNHIITLNSGKTIEATGKDGVAARFDFGSNELSDLYEYRGSYILTKYTSKEDIDEMRQNDPEKAASMKIGWSPIEQGSLVDDINGALVTDFNVAGTLKGEKAAIYISENALVQKINIMNGASLQGDIISKWNPNGIIYDNPPAPEGEENNNNDQVAALSTTGEEIIPVGGDSAGVGGEPINPSEEYEYKYEYTHLKPTTGAIIDLGFGTNVVDGVRMGSDSEFKMTYNGNIKGENGLNMHIMGGNLEYNGTAEVLGVIIEGDPTLQTSGATLSGKGTYILTANENGTRGTFMNKGTFELGDGITTINIKGNYMQDYYGNMLVDFNSDAGSDKLNITEGTATLDGKITLTPQVDYYFNR
ncbi:MAG: hypothetical protein ACI3WU_00565, partial [Phascolarctobacterium sp.]